VNVEWCKQSESSNHNSNPCVRQPCDRAQMSTLVSAHFGGEVRSEKKRNGWSTREKDKERRHVWKVQGKEMMSQHFHIWRNRQITHGSRSILYMVRQAKWVKKLCLRIWDKERKTHITTKLTLGFLSNLQYQKRLNFSHLFVLCMHGHANSIYSATASSVPTHCQSPWFHHRAVEWHKTKLVISEYVYYYTEKNVPVASS